MKRGYSEESENTRHLARSIGVPFVDLMEYRISPGILRKVPKDIASRYRCVAMIYNCRRVVLVHDDPASPLFLSCDPGLLSSHAFPGPGLQRVLEFALTTSTALDASLTRRLSLPE